MSGTGSGPARERLVRLRPDMEKCFRCSLCKMVPLPTVKHVDFTDACPAARHFAFHGYSGSGKSIMSLSLLDGRIPEDEALARLAFACTACGFCDVACKFIMDAERQRINMTLREVLWEKGLAPEALKKFAPGPQGGAAHWSHGLEVEKMPGGRADILVLSGSLGETHRRAARKLVKLLKSAGEDVGVLAPEPDLGLMAYWFGRGGELGRIAEGVAATIEKIHPRAVVVASGAELGVMRSKYPEFNRVIDADVLHSTEFLADLIGDEKIKLKNPLKKAVTYHDPCYLGRQGEPYRLWKGEEKIAFGVMNYTEPPQPINRGVNGVFDDPRRIIKWVPGLEFREMYRIREYSYCCGGGGGAPLSFPELAKSAALHRIEEARSVGAEVIATACSHCRMNFEKAQEDIEPEKRMEIADVIDLVFEASGLKE